MGLLTKLRNRGDDDTVDDNDDSAPDVGDERLLFSNGSAANGVLTAKPRKRGSDEATPQERKAKLLVFGMLSSIPIACLAILIAIAAIATGGSSDDTTGTAAGSQGRYAGYAHIVAVDYLAGRNTVVPTNNPDGLAPTRRPVPADGQREPENPTPPPVTYDALTWLRVDLIQPTKTSTPIEVHYFAVHTPTVVLELSVPIADHNGPTLAGLPSLGPMTVGALPENPDLNWGAIYTRTQLDERAVAQIQRWAEAYAANDGATLYSLTGDPEPHLYQGLGGFKINGPIEVMSAAAITTANTDAWLVAVQLDLVAITDNRLRFTTNYDLLLTDITRADPSISAWSAHGAGSALTPYRNALPAPEDTNRASTTTTATPGLPAPATQAEG